MLVPAIRIVLTAGFGLLLASPAPAQSAVGHFSHVDGSVTRLHRFASASAGPTSGVRRPDHDETAGHEGGQSSAQVGLVLLADDQVHVAMGRAEITLIDGSLVQLDEHTRVVLHAADRVQVIEGRLFIRSNGPGAVVAEAGGKRLHVAPGSAAEVTLSTTNDLLVRVVDGDARIDSSLGSDAVVATQSAFVSGSTGLPFLSPWRASAHDGFHRWAGGRVASVAPPPTFLPYAHPTYRQQEYARLLRSQRSARRIADGTPRDRVSDTPRRGGDRRAGQRGGEQGGGERMRGTEPRGGNRGDNTAQPNRGRPSAKAPAVKARGAGKGVVVRPR